MATPIIKKQLVAFIDERTSVICLHAAGQVVGIDEPFDTLAGFIDQPPFHFGCRSISMPYVDGFRQQERALAREEIKRRPPGQRAQFLRRRPVRSAVPDKSQTLEHRIGALRPDLTTRTLRSIAKGTIDPVTRLRPERLRRVFDALPERYEMAMLDASLAPRYVVRDRITGRRFVLRALSAADVERELAYVRVAELTGAPHRALTVLDADARGVWVLSEHAELSGWRLRSSGGLVSRLGARLADPTEPIRMAITDYVLGNDVRGVLSIGQMRRGQRWRIVPTENSGAFTMTPNLTFAEWVRRRRPIGRLLSEAADEHRVVVGEAVTEAIAALRGLDVGRLAVGSRERAEIVRRIRSLEADVTAVIATATR